MKILNMYAGMGGNRAKWGDTHEITAVEYDPAIAEIYKELYPNDIVVVGDANEYLVAHFAEFDFIWLSPPCPSHGQYRHNVGVIGKGFDPIIPDMTTLYGAIVFLQTYFKGDWICENVKPYYGTLIEPRFEMHRHLFWGTFDVPPKEFKKAEIGSKNKISDFDNYEVVKRSKAKNKRQVLRNCVDSDLGFHILKQIDPDLKEVSEVEQIAEPDLFS